MSNDNYENNYNPGPNVPPVDNSNDSLDENSKPLEPDAVYGVCDNGEQNSNFNYGSTVPPQPPQQPKKKTAKSKGIIIFTSIIIAVIIIAGILVGVYFHNGSSTEPSKKHDEQTSEVKGDASLHISDTPEAKPSKKGQELSAAEVYDKVQASNVGIVVYSKSTSSASGEGSGIVMGEDKTGKYTYIITCAHVIDGKDIEAVVQLHDGTQYNAEIVGYDVRTDIGVLKIKATGLKAAEFGDSTKLKVGETVYALGNPGGMEFFGSFTHGMVSAISRPVSSQIGYSMECIQHTAAISPGNSGGALINSQGQIIGINSLKITDVDYELIGFAIPITSAKPIIDDLIAYGRVPNRPKLGISYYSNSSNQQYSMIVQIKGLPAGSLIIADISKDSSLANTKAQVGDLIIGVNGKDLTTPDILLETIDKAKVGDTITLRLCRISSNYQMKEFDVKAKLVEDKGSTAVVEQNENVQENLPFNPFNGR